MTVTLLTIAKSIADYLAPYLPGVQWEEDPTQQGVTPPCAFVQQRYANTERRQAGRKFQRIGLDITYLDNYNLPNLQQKYLAAAEAIDPVLDTIPYNNGTETTLIHTFDREWRIDEDALHYKFEVRLWVYIEEPEVKMRTMDYDEEVVTDGEKVRP